MTRLTPDAATGLLCRRVLVPVELADHFTGALAEMVNVWEWEAFGDLTPDQCVQLAQEMIASIEDRCMVGTVVEYLTSTPPDGVLALDGSTYDREDYPALYDALDPIFILDADHFQLPDMRGKVTVGAGSSPGLTTRDLGDSGGAESVSLTIAEMPAHDHSYDLATSDLLVLAPGEAPASSGFAAPTLTTSTGGGGDHENMPPFGVAHKGVWYK